MNSPDVVTACRQLFKIQPFLAHGIIPVLRLEDVKIALAKQLQKTSDDQQFPPAEIPMNSYLESYTILTEYIERHNLEVILTLEDYHNNSINSPSYLFPLASSVKVVPTPHRSIVSKKELFFSGRLPPRRLRLGTFLYYRGLISYYQVIESIAWQKNRRPLIGQMAMQIGKLTANQFARIMVHVKNGECFGTIARKQKLLSDSVIQTLVKAQEKYDCRIGRYFVEKRILSDDEIRKLEEEMCRHNKKFR